jgi:deoxyadenosine/deoxycytidine kinase
LHNRQQKPNFGGMSQTNTFPYQFIAVEGNIGAGKTTFTQQLAAEYGCRLILEQFADNPFLPLFYDNAERYAFSVELFFMTERHKQLQDQLAQIHLFQQSVIADYVFIKTLLFAKNNLKEEEYRLFQRLFYILNASFPKPDLLVYLHRPVEQLLKNIRKRGREYEQDISNEYLEQIQKAYLDYFRAESGVPILIVELEDADFANEAQVYEALKSLLFENYQPGLHYRQLAVSTSLQPERP